MPKTLAPIPAGVAITLDAQNLTGVITDFFRLRWQSLIDNFQTTPDVATQSWTGQVAALATTTLYTTKTAGYYRVSYYLDKTVADGVSSSLQVTVGWTEGGSARTSVFGALTTDSIGANQSGSVMVPCDGASALTIAVAYASNTPNKMTYRADAITEQMA